MKHQTPNTKHQPSSKHQNPMPAVTERWRINVWKLGFIWCLVFGVWCFRTMAEIPEPDNILWGAITLANQPVTAADSDIVVEARKTANGPVVASYRMGDAPTYGNLYSLRIPLEAFLPLADTNANRIGGLVYLIVRDASGIREQRTTSIAARGKFTRIDFVELDADGDGLPDRWEQQYFGSPTGGNPNADPDGDGRSNLSEFLGDTNPLLADGRHPADLATADNVLTFEEIDDYTAAWVNGDAWSVEPTNIPIAYVTRAATLWLGGESYIFTNSPPTNAPMWWVNLPPLPASPAGTNLVSSQLPTTHPRSQPLFVPIRVLPRESVLVYAVEDTVPPGWTVLDISHGGVFDPVNRKVKWGPFFDAGERDVYYQATPPATNALVTFTGIASFDGFNVPIAGSRTVTIGGLSGSLRFVSSRLEGIGPTFVLSGQPSATYVIEVSTNLTQWLSLQTISTDVAGRYQFRPVNPAQSPHRFYRARTP